MQSSQSKKQERYINDNMALFGNDSELTLVIKAQNLASKVIKDVQQNVDAFQKKTKDLQPTFKEMARVGTIAFGAITASAGFAVKEAAKAEGSYNKFNTVFAEGADGMMSFINDIRKEMPTATHEIVRMAADMQDLLVPMGLTREKGAELSQGFLDLANKVAAFNDVDPTQVLEAIKSGLSGSSEPLRQFGINALETALEAKALEMGLLKVGEKFMDLDPQIRNSIRAQALYEQAVDNSADAINGFAANNDSFIRRNQELQATLTETRKNIGDALLPVIDDLQKKLLPTVQRVAEWAKQNPELTLSIIKWSAGISGTIAVLGTLGLILPKIITGVKALASAVQILKANIAGGIVITVALVGFSLVMDQITKLNAKIAQVRQQNQDAAEDELDFIKQGKELLASEDAQVRQLGEMQIELIKRRVAARSQEMELDESAMQQAISNLAGELEAKGKIQIINGEITLQQEELAGAAIGAGAAASGAMKDAADEIEMTAKQITDALKKVNDEIDDIVKQSEELKREEAKSTLELRQRLAELYVSQEEKVERIRQELAAETDAAKRGQLEDQLKREQSALESRRHLEESVQNEISDIRNLHAMTDFEQEMTLLQRRFAQEQVLLSEKRQAINQELSEKQKLRDALLELEKKQADDAIKESDRKTNAVINNINKEIDANNRLAEARSRANSTPLSTLNYTPAFMTPRPMADGGIVTRPTFAMIGEDGPEAVIPLKGNRGVGGVTIINNFNNPVLQSEADKDDIERRLDQALRSILLNHKISTA